MDEHDLVLPLGTMRRIQIKGESVFAGYWQLPEKTAQKHRSDGFFMTGYLGALSSDGYLTIVGRDKDLIISEGFMSIRRRSRM